MQRGFTLIELMVATSIFVVVMVLALGSLISISVAERKAETIKTVMNNLDFTIDSMTRSLRTGKDYHCSSPSGNDCINGASYIEFTAAPRSFSTCPSTAQPCRVAYCLDPVSTGGVIKRQITNDGSAPGTVCSAGTFLPITAPEVNIHDLKFYVLGSKPYPSGGCASPPVSNDCYQPKVTLTLFGSVQVNAMASSTFNLQTTVVQRLYDQ